MSRSLEPVHSWAAAVRGFAVRLCRGAGQRGAVPRPALCFKALLRAQRDRSVGAVDFRVLFRTYRRRFRQPVKCFPRHGGVENIQQRVR